MKNNPMNRLLIPTLSAVLTFLLPCTGFPAVAQQADGSDSIPRHRKAWEIGVGIHGMQLTRFNVTGFSPGSNGGYRIDTDKRDVLFGGHLYLARELNSHFFLDLQGNADFTADPVRGGKEKRWTAMAGLGLQWRLGEYFRSPYIDPFLRAGANYLYKNFTVGYNGLERLNAEEMKWDLANDFDKEGALCRPHRGEGHREARHRGTRQGGPGTYGPRRALRRHLLRLRPCRHHTGIGGGARPHRTHPVCRHFAPLPHHGVHRRPRLAGIQRRPVRTPCACRRTGTDGTRRPGTDAEGMRRQQEDSPCRPGKLF